MQMIKEWVNRLSDWGESVAVYGILLMVALTCADVISSKFFNMPIADSTELVRLVQVVTIGLAIASTQKVGLHINVDMFLIRWPLRAQALVRSLTSLLGLAIFTIAVYKGIQYGYSLHDANEVTGTLRMPIYPFALVFSLALIPLACMLLFDFIESVREVFSKWSR